MDAAFVRERIPADDRLVVLHRERGRRRDELRGARQHGGVDIGPPRQQERQKLAQRYESLQRQLETPAAAPATAPSDPQREEIAALKERQQRVLASIQRDLAASQQREQELRDTLTATQGQDGLPLAESVGNLRAENQALQARLDDQHQRNSELAGKLKIASRVTELIFKMQTASGASEVAPPSEVSAPLP